MASNVWKNRKLWGVMVSGAAVRQEHLISTLWNGHHYNPYPDEPPRALLFTTRKAAREWCRAKQGISNVWRYRPVRVVESVRVVK